MDTDGGPQADDGGEQGLINDGRLMINDVVHTENTEGNGGPQADGGGERESPGMKRELKEKKYIHRCHRWMSAGGRWRGTTFD